jgi:hypothetical protein
VNAALLLSCGGLAVYPDGGVASYPSSFTQGRFAFSHLSLPDDDDVDGNGEVDNHLPDVLRLVDAAVPERDLDPASFDALLQDNIANHSTILMDAATVGLELWIAFLWASREGGDLVPDKDAYNEEGHPTETVVGRFLGPQAFVAGPSTLRLDVVGALDLEPLPITLSGAMVTGDLDEGGVAGTVQAVLPVEATMNDFVLPLLPAEGYDIDGDGVPESVEELTALLAELAPSLGDVALPYGETGVSVTLLFEAVPATWLDP